MAIRIGCGSFADAAYRGLLYPRGFPPELRLCGYAMWFDCLEVNATYYAIPRLEAVKRWIQQTPSTFLFDLRLPRAISQSPKKAGQDGKLLQLLLKNLKPLFQAERLGTFLLVLSPSFTPERHRLEELEPLLERIRPHPLSVELRHSDWVAPGILASTRHFFRSRKLTWVSVDMPQIQGSTLMPYLDEVTQPQLAYLRLHGRNPGYEQACSAAERHTYFYTETELAEIAQRITQLAKKAQQVRVVANNHARDFAPRTALALRELLGQAL